MKLRRRQRQGGTGKTTVAANFDVRPWPGRDEVVAVDCDVEGPNLHLFFPSPSCEVPVRVPVPAVDPARCTLCGECGRFCRFGAISVLKTGVFFLPDLCHSAEGAVRMSARERHQGLVSDGRIRPVCTSFSISDPDRRSARRGRGQAPAVVSYAKRACRGGAAHHLRCAARDRLHGDRDLWKGADTCLLVTESTPVWGPRPLCSRQSVAKHCLPPGSRDQSERRRGPGDPWRSAASSVLPCS